MDAHVENIGISPDGTQTRGMKGMPYDWERLLVPDETEFDSELSRLIDAAVISEPSAT